MRVALLAELRTKEGHVRNALTLAVLIWLASANNVSAAEFVADSAQDISLSAPGGFYQQKLYELTPTGPSALRARVTFSKVQENPDWPPSIGFGVKNGDDTLWFNVSRFRAGETKSYFRKVTGNKETDFTDFDFEPREGETFMFQMEWTMEGKVTASIGRNGQMERREGHLGRSPSTLAVLVTGGTLDIMPLELGHMEAVTSSLSLADPGHSAKARPAPAVQTVSGVCATAVGSSIDCRQLKQ
jgi:hypothetical protein